MDFSILTYHLMLPLLEYFRHALGNYGWAIILVTVIIKLFLLPLSIKQALSSQKMQKEMAKIKPELNRIQERFNQRKKKYENNPEKVAEIQKEFQEQMMALYKSNGVGNPLAGCLPTLLQIPLLIALYLTFSGPPFQTTVLHIPLKASAEVSTQVNSKNIFSAPVNFVSSNGEISRLRLNTNISNKLIIGELYELNLEKIHGKGEIPAEKVEWHILGKGQNPMQAVQPTNEKSWAEGIIELKPNKQKATIKALKPTEKFELQVQIKERRGHQTFLFIEDLGRSGFFDKINKQIHWDILILIVFMGLSFWFSNKIMMNSTTQMPSLDPSQEEMQKQMQTLLPIMFLVMMVFVPLPAGVFIYFIVSNIFQILQSVLLKKWGEQNNTNEQ